MFCSVRRHWQQASTLVLAFACISACQNVTDVSLMDHANGTAAFAADLEKSSSSDSMAQGQLNGLGLEAQATALTVDSKIRPTITSANVATEVQKPISEVSKGNRADSKSSKGKISSFSKISTKSKIVTTAKAPEPNQSKAQATATLKTTVSSKTTKTSKAAASVSNETASIKTSTGAPATSAVKLKISTDKNAKKTATKATTTATKTTRKPRSRKVMLVPPPPPTMPSYLNTSSSPISGSFDLGLSVNYMSLDDLKFQQKNLEKKLESAKLDDKDQKLSTAEKKDRANRFVELYEEGVVSRRELETAQNESERSLRDIEQTHIKVSEIERVLGQVKERIASMEAAKRQFKVSSKKSKTR